MKQKYPLTDTEIRATDSASVVLRADSSRRHDLDALDLMNNLCQWDDPPPSEARWEKKVAHACVIAVGFCKMANNYKEEVEHLESEVKRLKDKLSEAKSTLLYLNDQGPAGLSGRIKRALADIDK